jgi:hypothetical protein
LSKVRRLRIENALDRCCQRSECILLLGVVAVAIMDAVEACNDMVQGTLAFRRAPIYIHAATV